MLLRPKEGTHGESSNCPTRDDNNDETAVPKIPKERKTYSAEFPRGTISVGAQKQYFFQGQVSFVKLS